MGPSHKQRAGLLKETRHTSIRRCRATSGKNLGEERLSWDKWMQRQTLMLIFLSHKGFTWRPQGHAHNPVLKKQDCSAMAERRTLPPGMPLSKVSSPGREHTAPFSNSCGHTPAHRAQPQWQGVRQIPKLMGFPDLEDLPVTTER